MPKSKSEAAKAPTFEEQLAALEALVERMESGELPLEALLTAYQQGMAISAELRERLEKAQGELVELREGKPAQPKAKEPGQAVEQTSLLDE